MRCGAELEDRDNVQKQLGTYVINNVSSSISHKKLRLSEIIGFYENFS